MRIEVTVAIARPPEDVFDYLTALENLPEWQDSLVEVRPDDGGDTRVGSRFHEVRTARGRRIESDVEVTELERPRRFTVAARSGPVPFTVVHELEPSDSGTRLRVTAEGEPKGALRFASRMIEREARAAFNGDFGRLKAILERGG